MTQKYYLKHHGKIQPFETGKEQEINDEKFELQGKARFFDSQSGSRMKQMNQYRKRGAQFRINKTITATMVAKRIERDKKFADERFAVVEGEKVIIITPMDYVYEMITEPEPEFVRRIHHEPKSYKHRNQAAEATRKRIINADNIAAITPYAVAIQKESEIVVRQEAETNTYITREEDLTDLILDYQNRGDEQ